MQAPGVIMCAAALLALGACQEERRVVRTSGGLQGLPGAEGGVETEAPLVARPGDAAPGVDPSNPAGYSIEAGDESLRFKNPDGSITLVCRNPRELMFHLRKTLQDEERALTLEQVLSSRTREAYRAKGLRPEDAVDFLLTHRWEIFRLLQQLPMGEMTPGTFAKPIGPSEFRLEVPPHAVDPPLRFRKFDYVFERGGCRLLLIS